MSRFNAVVEVRKLEFGGFVAWLSWLFLHLIYLVGHKNRFTTLVSWIGSFLGKGRGQLAITERWIYARRALEQGHDKETQINAAASAEV